MNYFGLPNYQPTKRKVFISFHRNDQVEAEALIEIDDASGKAIKIQRMWENF
jgi:hypothetical protein